MKRKHHFLLGLSAVAISGTLLYGGYQYGIKQASASKIAQPEVKAAASWIAPRSLVKAQQALVVGQITAKSADTITVKGEDGTEARFKLAPSLNISTIAASSSATPAKPTQDKSAITLNHKALITLDLKENNEYQVTDITFVPK